MILIYVSFWGWLRLPYMNNSSCTHIIRFLWLKTKTPLCFMASIIYLFYFGQLSWKIPKLIAKRVRRVSELEYYRKVFDHLGLGFVPSVGQGLILFFFYVTVQFCQHHFLTMLSFIQHIFLDYLLKYQVVITVCIYASFLSPYSWALCLLLCRDHVPRVL